MKLAKLSLAAVVAVTAMTTFASAASLEEAIKGVDLSGFMRYRFYSEDGAKDASGDRHRFSAPFAFTMPVADGIKAGMTVRYEGSHYAADAAEAGSTDFSMTKAWFSYSNKQFVAKIGKQEINSPWTDPGYGGTRGNGVIAMYKGVPGWTFAAAAFANTVNADAGIAALGQENLYAAAAIGSFGSVNAQVWFANMTNAIDSSIFAQLDSKFAGFTLKGQVNVLTLADELVPAGADDTGTFYALEAGYGMNGFTVGAGYIANDDDQGVHTLNADDAGMIKAGKQLYYQTTNLASAETMFAKVGYGMGVYSVGAGYSSAEVDAGDLGTEWYIEGGYKYSKNFGLALYYSDMDMEVNAKDNKELRFEAKYSF